MFWVILDPQIATRFGHLICLWMLHQKAIILGTEERRWVEYGFARFGSKTGTCDMREDSSDMGQDASDMGEDMEDQYADETVPILDEPLIMLAADYHLSTTTTLGLDHVVMRLGEPPGRGTHFEECLAVYFSKAFGSDVRLCDVFDFGDSNPRWAERQGVQLVALSGGNWYPVDRSRWTGCPISLCCEHSKGQDTVNWFRKPSSTMCFPDILFGPDLVFFVRVGQRLRSMIICVIVQARFRSSDRLAKSVQEDAVSTLTASQFYKHKVTSLGACPQVF
jgi:hypothetical protein